MYTHAFVCAHAHMSDGKSCFCFNWWTEKAVRRLGLKKIRSQRKKSSKTTWLICHRPHMPACCSLLHTVLVLDESYRTKSSVYLDMSLSCLQKQGKDKGWGWGARVKINNLLRLDPQSYPPTTWCSSNLELFLFELLPLETITLTFSCSAIH